MKRIEPKLVWRIMPVIPVVCSVITSLEGDPSLHLLAFSVFAAKCMDYSLRAVVNEMVRGYFVVVCVHYNECILQTMTNHLWQIYVPLDFESRYVVRHAEQYLNMRWACVHTVLTLRIYMLLYRARRLLESLAIV
jgi:hypothetical protein